MTSDTELPVRDQPGRSQREREAAIIVARGRVGAWAFAAGIGLFSLADLVHPPHPIHRIVLVRAAQFGMLAWIWLWLGSRRGQLAPSVPVAVVASGIYVTSAMAGVLRGGVSSQPITDLAIAFTTATTLQWGPGPQLVTVLVAMASIAWNVWGVEGTFADTSPHMASAIAVAFLVSVFIAHELRRYRRERDAAEAALRSSEERFRALIEGGSEIITIVEADGAVAYESPSMERLLWHRTADVVGRKAMSYIHRDDRPAVEAAFATAVAGTPTTVEYRVRRVDGSWCEAEATLTSFLHHPAVRGVVVNWRDVGERKRAERERASYIHDLARARDRALASTRAKSLFLANVSHEIRTPMNIIIGMTDMVLDATQAPEQRDALLRVRRAALGLLGIINDILDASKIEAGKMRLELVDVDVREIAEDVVRLHATAASAKGVPIVHHVDADVPERIRVDPVRLRQVLVNLVGNAVKFTDAGRIEVGVALASRAPGHVVLRVAVRDTGIGIPPERHGAIFESFSQADTSTTRLYGGTGLGLTICRQLVELMGGRIGVDSTPGRGSCFWFELPTPCADAADASAA